MKVNIFLAILFTIVTSFTAIHEVEHIGHTDTSSCQLSHVNSIDSADIISEFEFIQAIYLENIQDFTLATKLYFKQKDNQNRAPPSLS